MSLVVKAPWTPEQVEALNRLQHRPDVHGYTCEEHSDVRLTAITDGWFCPFAGCTYIQDWALG